MGAVIFFLMFVSFIVFLIVWSVKHGRKIRRSWRQFADRHGLEFSGEGLSERPDIEGRYKDVPLRILIEVHGSGKNRRTYTRYSATFTSLPAGLNITREGFGDKIFKFFGGQDIQVGIRHVDEALRIKGSDEDAVRRFLQNEAVCSAVMKLVVAQGGAVTEGTATILDNGYAKNEGVLQSRTDQVVDAVRDIEQALGYRRPAAAISTGRTAVPGAVSHEGNGGSVGTKGEPSNVEPSVVGGVAAAAPGPPPELSNTPGSSQAASPLPAVTPADEALFAELSKLRDRSAGFLERPDIIRRIQGRRLSGRMTVEQVTWTSGLHLSERVQGGRSVIGTLPDGLNVGVSFAKARDAELETLTRGDELQFSGIVAQWDDIYDRLLLEAE